MDKPNTSKTNTGSFQHIRWAFYLSVSVQYGPTSSLASPINGAAIVVHIVGHNSLPLPTGNRRFSHIEIGTPPADGLCYCTQAIY